PDAAIDPDCNLVRHVAPKRLQHRRVLSETATRQARAALEHVAAVEWTKAFCPPRRAHARHLRLHIATSDRHAAEEQRAQLELLSGKVRDGADREVLAILLRRAFKRVH